MRHPPRVKRNSSQAGATRTIPSISPAKRRTLSPATATSGPGTIALLWAASSAQTWSNMQILFRTLTSQIRSPSTYTLMPTTTRSRWLILTGIFPAAAEMQR
jgi:hypothetical protein